MSQKRSVLNKSVMQVGGIRCEEMESMEGIHSWGNGMNLKQGGERHKSAQEGASIQSRLEVLPGFLPSSSTASNPKIFLKVFLNGKRRQNSHILTKLQQGYLKTRNTVPIIPFLSFSCLLCARHFSQVLYIGFCVTITTTLRDRHHYLPRVYA